MILKLDPNAGWLNHALHVLASMLAPGDSKIQELVDRVLTLETVISELNDSGETLSLTGADLEAIRGTPTVSGLIHELQDGSLGWIAGDILRHAMGIKEPSLNKAIALFQHERIHNYGGKTQSGARIPAKTETKEIWARFRPVSHLWCAWRMPDEKGRLKYQDAFIDENVFRGFLGAADSFLNMAAKTYAKGQSRSFINREDCITVSDDIERPEITLTRIENEYSRNAENIVSEYFKR